MRSAQVLSRSRMRNTSQNRTDKSPSVDEDSYSIISWSNFNNINGNGSTETEYRQQQSFSPPATGSPSHCARGFKYAASEQTDDFPINNKETRNSNDGEHYGEFPIPTTTAGGGTTTEECFERLDPNTTIWNWRTVHTDTLSPSLDFMPLSSDLKSASFDYTPLWENPVQPLPNHSVNQTSTSTFAVIKRMDRKQRSQSLKPRDLSTSPTSQDNQAQSFRLYPDLEELRISSQCRPTGSGARSGHSGTCDQSDNSKLYPQLPAQVDRYSPPKGSANRPRFLNFQNGNSAKAERSNNFQVPATLPSSYNDTSAGIPTLASRLKKKRMSDFGVRNSDLRDAGNSQPVQPVYFKSSPVLATQQSAGQLPSSSRDLESMNNRLLLEHRLEPENMKSKMMSVWNNIKYGWTFKSKSSMKSDSPLYLLGTVYHKRTDENEEPEFLLDFTSRIWLTYRSNFYPIPGTKLTTDCGWGCMLRSGQMLLAQCFLAHFLQREWRINQNQNQPLYYWEILRWFSDPIEAPSDKAPFCLHHLVTIGRHYKKLPGEWYGPASAAYIFRDALNKANMSIPILKDLCIYVAQDCTVFIDDINQLCRTRPKSDSGNDSFSHTSSHKTTPDVNSQPDNQATADSGSSSTAPWCRSLIILIPVRLGGEVMNDIYMPCIKSLLSYGKCMGIIGGKPKHSMYFIGWQDDKLIYLDPHYCREAVDTSYKDFNNASFHCDIPRMLSMTKMDPSCTIGFYIRDETEFKTFVHDVTQFVSPPKQRGLYPLFIFSNGSQEDAELAQEQYGTERGRVKVKHYVVDQSGQRRRTLTRESEEFILL